MLVPKERKVFGHPVRRSSPMPFTDEEFQLGKGERVENNVSIRFVSSISLSREKEIARADLKSGRMLYEHLH